MDWVPFAFFEEKKMNTEIDLTTGSISKKLLVFSVPLLIANLLQSLYSIADMLVVGRIVGENGLAAISNASMITFILTSVCIGITMGGTVLVAQYKGAGSGQGQIETVGTLFTFSFFAALVITVLSLYLYEPVFSMLKVPDNAMNDACEYMKIICFGTVFVFGYNAVCSILKGFGDSRNPLYFVGIATILNVILDVLLVGYFDLGTKGAAYATVFSQGISFVISVVHLRRIHFIFDFTPKNFKIKKDKLLIILKIGIPTAVQMVIVNISYTLITGMLNVFGVSIAAAAGIGLKVNTFAGMPCWAVGQSVTAMVGQNMGIKNIERTRKTVKAGIYLGIAVTLITTVLVQIFAEPIITLFVDSSNTEVIKDGILYLRICCSVNSLVYAVMYTFDSFAIGVGSANIAMVNAILDACVVRLLVSWLLAFALGFGFIGIFIGQALSPLIPALAGFIYYQRKTWEKKNLI